ncbi:MAG: hypothetical protein N3D82_04235 [Ignisphaera sp.]|nr:hypothetical protein [Ignisphaera sp.]MCX8168217.1 hypothetical protein [Ignisphaera sp.]MDW8084913.1 hypothetical protein [Ignisphaera sp.]
MHEGVPIHRVQQIKLNNILPPLHGNITLRIVNKSSLNESISEDELAVIAAVIRMHIYMKRGNGEDLNHNDCHNNPCIDSKWLVKWILETADSDPLKYNANGFNGKIRLIDSEYEIPTFTHLV